jgi:hypothetical protein
VLELAAALEDDVDDVDSTLEDVVGNAELLEAADDKETIEVEAAAELEELESDELTPEAAADELDGLELGWDEILEDDVAATELLELDGSLEDVLGAAALLEDEEAAAELLELDGSLENVLGAAELLGDEDAVA